jgi:hypothetical protein
MENLKKFANFYRSASTFGPARVDDIENPNEEILNISTDEFLNEMYVEVPMEKFLEDKLINDTLGKLIAVCGPSGSGKSSVSFKVKNNLKDNQYLIIFLDFKIEFSTKINDDNTETIDESRIRRLILNSFNREFPLDIESEFSKKDELLYFLLSPEKELVEKKTDQVFLDFTPLQDRIAIIYKKYNKTNKQNFKEWYLENHSLYDEILQIKKEAFDLIDIAHYIHYIVYAKIYKKVIIWIDNIDSFSNLQQIKIAGFLHGLERSILNLSQIVICVREENIYRYGAFNEKYSEPFISMVTFADKNKLDTTEYGAINVPVISFEKLKEIVKNKVKFCRKLYERRFENEKMNEVLYFEFESLSEKLVQCFENEKIIFLANNSLREYLSIHSKYIAYLTNNCSINEKFKLSDNELPHWKLTTKFLSWVYTVNEPFRLDTFNVLYESNTFDSEKEDTTGCFLPYIILTRIWNECNRLTGQHCPLNNPELGVIIDEIIQDFSFSEEQVLNATNNLLQRTFGQGNFITLRNKVKIEKPKDLKEIDSTVRITYRGKVAIGSIIHSYGYLRECTNRLLSFEEKKGNLDDFILKKIEKICDDHIISLRRIKQRIYQNDHNWFSKYLIRYGTIVETPFIRNKSVGIIIPNHKHRRALYVECLLSSLFSYFNYHDKNLAFRVSEINKNFQNNLKQIL